LIFLFDFDYSLLDYIEGVSIISLVEDYLPFFIGFSQAAAGDRVFLLLGQIFEEREHL